MNDCQPYEGQPYEVQSYEGKLYEELELIQSHMAQKPMLRGEVDQSYEAQRVRSGHMARSALPSGE